MTVNTCTADYPRALPTYLRAGFRTLRQVRELWNVPLRLGMRIPERLLNNAGIAPPVIASEAKQSPTS